MPEGIEFKDLTYTHIREFMPKKGKSFEPIKVVGYFISKGKFGLGVSLIAEDDTGYFGINIPPGIPTVSRKQRMRKWPL